MRHALREPIMQNEGFIQELAISTNSARCGGISGKARAFQIGNALVDVLDFVGRLRQVLNDFGVGQVVYVHGSMVVDFA